MTKTINCAECNVEFTFEENPKYPRKYCLNCSAKKKASYESKGEEPTASGNTEFENVPMNPEKTNGFKLTEKNIRIGALTCAIAASNKGIADADFQLTLKKFEEYIRNGK